MACSKIRQDWHEGAKLRKTLEDFHSREATFPREVHEAKQALERYLGAFDSKLRSVGFGARVEYTGSSYEGIKIGATDLEFDVLIVMTNGDKLAYERVSGHPGYYKIKPNGVQNRAFFTSFLGGDELLPKKVIDKLEGHLADLCRDSPSLVPGVVLRRHGPAMQADVMKGSRLWFSVDIVPAVETSINNDRKRFVAKPFKGDASGHAGAPTAWRISYSLEEKAILSAIDRGNECRKQCTRIVKAICRREPTLQHICSYWIKTTVLRHKDSWTWSQEKLGHCVIRLLSAMGDAFQTRSLPHAFIPQLNLLSAESPVTCENVAGRLGALISNEARFYNALGMQV